MKAWNLAKIQKFKSQRSKCPKKSFRTHNEVTLGKDSIRCEPRHNLAFTSIVYCVGRCRVRSLMIFNFIPKRLANVGIIVHAIPLVVTWRSAVVIGLKICEYKSHYPDVAQTSLSFWYEIEYHQWAYAPTTNTIHNACKGAFMTRFTTNAFFL